jgi:integrase/recombinase XerD
MGSIKVLLKKNKQNEDGSYPVYIRAIKDRKTRFMALGIKLFENQWDEKEQRVKKNHPNSVRMNALVSKKKAEAEAENLDLVLEERTFNAHSFEQVKGRSKHDFFQFAQKYIDNLQATGKIGTYRRAKYTIEKLKAYKNQEPLYFHELTVQFLKDYQEHLVALGNKVNTIHSNLKLIRTIVNNAVNEKLLKRDKNPFYSFKLKSEATERAYLTEAELKAMEEIKLDPKTNLHVHRNMYIFAAYVGGLRISDLLQLRWSNFDGTHITLKIKKTGAPLSVKVPTVGLAILDYYKDITFNDEMGEPNAANFIFPVLPGNYDKVNKTEAHRIIVAKTALINKNLKIIAKRLKITKNISFHSSRHTWATRALRKGVTIDKVSKLMGHSSLKETQVYAKIVNEELDRAMDVFND